MVVEAIARPISYVTDGVVQTFGIPWPFDSNAHIEVSTQIAGVAQIRALNVDYRIRLNGDGAWIVDTAGLAGALPAGRLTVRRKQPGQQTTPFRDQTRFPAARVAEMGDRLARAIQDMDAEADLALRLHPTDHDLLDFLPPIAGLAGKSLKVELIPGVSPARYRIVGTDFKGDKGEPGDAGPVGPPIAFAGSLNNTNELPAPGTVPDATAYKIGADVWVRGRVAGAPAWVNLGPLTGSNLMTVRWNGNTIANNVSVIDLGGQGVINVSSPSTGVVSVRIDPPSGAGGGVIGYSFVENWNEATNFIDVAGYAGAQAAQVEVLVNGTELLNNNTDWQGSASGADYRVTIPSTVAKNGDSVAVRITATAPGGGGGGGGVQTFRQDEAPTTANNGDLWFDSNDQNAPYLRVLGQWTSIRDGAIGALATRMDAVETTNASQGSAITALQAADVTLGQRIDGVVAVNASQASAITNLQNADTAFDQRIDALEAAPASTPSNTAPGAANSVTFALAGGLSFIVQWGRVAVGDSARLPVTLPVPFSSGFYGLSCSYDGTSTTDERQVYASQDPTSPLTRIILTNTFNEVRAVGWIAIGY